MSLPLKTGHPKTEDRELRRFLSRAEAATLVGMVTMVFSLFLPWERFVLPLPPMPTLYNGMAGSITHTGFATSAWPPITICSALCAAILLFPQNEGTRLPLTLVQTACAVACLVITLTHLAMLGGVLVGLLGSLLLTFGAVDRFTTSDPARQS